MALRTRSPFLRQAVAAAIAAVVAASFGWLAAQERTAPKFYDDDPIARIPDTQDASQVQPRELSLYHDAIINLFGRPGRQQVGRAEGINSIDEVPESSWYTNRAPMSPDAVIRGVDDDEGPAPGKWSVSRKANGVSPGFTITAMNKFEGRRTAEEAAREPVRLALLGPEGPTGTFTDENGPIPW